MGQVSERGTEMKTYHDVEKVAFDGDVLLLKVDGKELSLDRLWGQDMTT